MGVRAKCSRCEYLRTFADELRGTFYRCPKCRHGVIAVPEDLPSSDPSDEAPSVRPATEDGESQGSAAPSSSSSSGIKPPERPAFAAKVPSIRQAATEDDAPALTSSASAPALPAIPSAPSSSDAASADAPDTASAPMVSGSQKALQPDEASEPGRQGDETPKGAFFGARPIAETLLDSAGEKGATGPGSTTGSTTGADDTGSTTGTDDTGSTTGTDDAAEPARGPRGPLARAVKVRRILVECALCGHHVAVPPELFGKTVHCPECRADMMFSESQLEPVKDEIIGRIALEHSERRALAHAVPGPIPSPDVIRRTRRRNLVIVGVLLGLLLTGIGYVGWKTLGPKPSIPKNE